MAVCCGCCPPPATPGASLLPPFTPFPVLHPEHTPHPGALKYLWATCMPSSRPLSWLMTKPCQPIGLGVVGSGQRGCLTRAVRDTPLPSRVPSPSSSPLGRALCSSCFRSRRLLPICPHLPLHTALADMSTLPLRAGPGAHLPAVVTQNWPWTWPTSRQMWSWGPWTGSLPCCTWPPHPLLSCLRACW